MENNFDNEIINAQNDVSEALSKAAETVNETADNIKENADAVIEQTTENINAAASDAAETVTEAQENVKEACEEMTADNGFFESAPVQQPQVIPEYVPQYTQPASQPYKKEKTGKGFFIGSLICLLLCITALVFTVLFSGNNKAEKPNDEKPNKQQTEKENDKENEGGYKIPESETPDYNPQTSEDGRYDFPTLIAKASPSVLLVSTEKGFGTGFVFTKDGYIITNEHVISGFKKATLTFIDGTECEAKVIGSDASLDIAVLKCDIAGLVPLELGDSDKTVAGEFVIAIGNPYDKSLANTSSEGIVSAIRKEYHFEELQTIADVIQHTASINSGNSGGPLFNMYGQVIGINAVKISGYENLGFAIAINSVKSAIEDIITNGTVQRPTLGITCQTNPYVGGVTVIEINEGSAAEKAGLKVNDVITKFDGIRVKSSEELVNILGRHAAGDTVELSVLRDVDSVVITIILDKAFENIPEEE